MPESSCPSKQNVLRERGSIADGVECSISLRSQLNNSKLYAASFRFDASYRRTVETQLIDQAEQLREDFGLRRRLTLTFPELHITVQALIKAFSEGYLVLLFRAETEKSSIEMVELYEDAIEWAKNHFQGLFHNEYYQIQQLNNQLIDSKQALARSISKLHQALKEMERIEN